MNALFLLCSGNNFLNNIPLFLNRHPDGKYLFQKALDGIDIGGYDRIFVIMQEKATAKFNGYTIVSETMKSLRDKLELVLLDRSTNGPAASIYEALKKTGYSGAFAVRDCSNTISLPESVKSALKGNFVVTLNISENYYIHDLKSKSFIIRNEQNQILDIIEKTIKSETVSVGYYGFASSEDYMDAYARLTDSVYSISMLYVSHIVAYLIGRRNQVFRTVDVDYFEEWNNRFSWMKIQNEYSINLIFLDRFFTKDESALYSFEDSMLQKFQHLKNRKCSSIFFTTYQFVDADSLKKKLYENGINVHDVIVINNCNPQFNVIRDSRDMVETLVRSK